MGHAWTECINSHPSNNYSRSKVLRGTSQSKRISQRCEATYLMRYWKKYNANSLRMAESGEVCWISLNGKWEAKVDRRRFLPEKWKTTFSNGRWLFSGAFALRVMNLFPLCNRITISNLSQSGALFASIRQVIVLKQFHYGFRKRRCLKHQGKFEWHRNGM